MGSEVKTAIIEHLGRQHQSMVALLAKLVNIDSGTYNKRGVDAVGDRLRTYLQAADVACEIVPNETFGDCIVVRLAASGGGNRPIVLMGPYSPTAPPLSGRSASTAIKHSGRGLRT